MARAKRPFGLYNTGQGRRLPGTPARPGGGHSRGLAAPDDLTEATPALEFLAQDDVLFFPLKLRPIGTGVHITVNSTISTIAEIVPNPAIRGSS